MGYGGGGARPTSRGVVSGARSNLRRLDVNALAFDAREFSRLSCHVESTPSFGESKNNVIALKYRFAFQ